MPVAREIITPEAPGPLRLDRDAAMAERDGTLPEVWAVQHHIHK
jgi:hypothetical protein